MDSNSLSLPADNSGRVDDPVRDDELRIDEVSGGVVVLSLNRPPANALTLDLRLRIRDAWIAIRDMPEVRAVVVTATGRRFFCSGLDLHELANDLGNPSKDANRRHAEIDQLQWDPAAVGLWKPIVAAINGYCLAGGLNLASMCDVRIAATHARFGVPEIRWSQPAAFTWSLPKVLPANIAMEMVLWADRQFTAQRMLELGYLNAVVPRSKVLSTAISWAQQVSRLDEVAVQRHKQMLYQATFGDRAQKSEEAERLLRPLHDRADIARHKIGNFLGVQAAGDPIPSGSTTEEEEDYIAAL